MSQSNKRSYEVRRSEYRPLNSDRQRSAQNGQRPRQPQARSVQRPNPQPQQNRYRAPQQRSNAYPQKRAYAPSRGRDIGLPDDFGKLMVVCASFIVIAIILQFAFPNGISLATKTGEKMATDTMISQIYTNGSVRINEIMTANRKTLTLADESSPDWIEIINTGSSSVNLSGYSLSKTADSTGVFTFPDMTLGAGECILLYADGKLSETVEAEMHVPFRLSSSGDTLMLFNAGGTAIDTVNIPSLNRDQSYIRVDGTHWQQSDMPTPGAANTEENYLAMQQKSGDSPVIINEIMAVNRATYAAQDGLYYDYIELYNASSESVDLGGWYLSDSIDYPRKWRLPEDTVIASGEYLIVFASGLDRKEGRTQLHTNFSLSSEGESVILSDSAGRIMDRVDFDLMKADVAYALQGDGTWANATGTPGSAN